MSDLKARLEAQIKKWRAQEAQILLDRDEDEQRGTPEYDAGTMAAELIRCCADEAAALLIGEEPPADQWQPIETCPRDREVFFWLVPKTADETFTDTSGNPIVSTAEPYWQRGRWLSWGSLSKPTHWRPLLQPPLAASPRVGAPAEGKYNEDVLLDVETRIFYAETSVQALAESARLLRTRLARVGAEPSPEKAK